jgi:hypothetical protein
MSSRTERFPKTLFTLSWCSIPRATGSGDLLPHFLVHAGAARWSRLHDMAQQREIGKTLIACCSCLANLCGDDGQIIEGESHD